MRNPSIFVLMAAINEEAGIGSTLAELEQKLENTTYLVVDGNSSDETVLVAKKMGAQTIYQKGQGKGDAIGEGIKYINDNPKYIVLTDADFTYPAKYLPGMIEILENNPKIGMVLGNRFNKMLSPRAMKNPYYVGNRFLAIAQHIINGIKLKDPLTGLRVLRWKLLKNWAPKSKGFDIEAELNYRVERLGYDIYEIPIDYRSRMGEKKLKLRHGYSILKRIITESLNQSVFQ